MYGNFIRALRTSRGLSQAALAEVRDDILAARVEARARKGWLFDTYLLRRRGG